jgi:NAD(P)-dependent dehydrogenase (short-subunit alcohol dehydrogenase family)
MTGPLEFRGRTALVTGAASGIGAETARRLAEGGARIVGVDRNGKTLRTRVAALPVHDPPHVVMEKDLRSADAARQVVPEAMAACGSLDIVVNAAGVCYFTPLGEISDDEYDEVMNVNVRALFLISVAAAEAMDPTKGGRIINLGSNAGRKGRPLSAHYAASKAAVKNISESLALAYGGKKVAVNTVCPGPTVTPMWDGNFQGLARITGKPAQEFWELWSRQTPLGRVGTTEDVANLICFLASDSASFITGQEINVCGGFMLTS